MMRNISVLGSTGSIGQSTLDIVRRYPQRFKVIGLSAGSNISLLKDQIEEFEPKVVSLRHEKDLLQLRTYFTEDVEWGFGHDGVIRVASHDETDIVVSAIVGSAGLMPTLAAIRAGKDIALANKETLVMAGRIVMREVRENGVTIIPVDSEHSAIYQSMQGHRYEDIKRLILTASGGPFLDTPGSSLGEVTPDQAAAHPMWKMGIKVSIDSASMMNKGLEVIEAHWLFGVSQERISVCIHPQSAVHSMVEYVDGSVIAQLGEPDMRTPIAYALSYPERIDSGAGSLDLCALKNLEFMEPDTEKFPCLRLAYDALRAGGTMMTVMNAADEVAVAAFIDRRICFGDLSRVVEDVMESHDTADDSSMDNILESDRWAREKASGIVKGVMK